MKEVRNPTVTFAQGKVCLILTKHIHILSRNICEKYFLQNVWKYFYLPVFSSFKISKSSLYVLLLI